MQAAVAITIDGGRVVPGASHDKDGLRRLCCAFCQLSEHVEVAWASEPSSRGPRLRAAEKSDFVGFYGDAMPVAPSDYVSDLLVARVWGTTGLENALDLPNIVIGAAAAAAVDTLAWSQCFA